MGLQYIRLETPLTLGERQKIFSNVILLTLRSLKRTFGKKEVSHDDAERNRSPGQALQVD